MDALSRRIRELRIDNDMKQGEMGAALGITQNMVSNYENGREPPFETVIAYSRYFGVSVEYLLGLTSEKAPATDKQEKAIDDMQTAATAHGHSPFTRADIAQLSAAFVEYYQAGAPAGSAPMACVTAFLPAMTRLLDAATHQDAAALLLACNDVARAGLDASHAAAAVLGDGQDAGTV